MRVNCRAHFSRSNIFQMIKLTLVPVPLDPPRLALCPQHTDTGNKTKVGCGTYCVHSTLTPATTLGLVVGTTLICAVFTTH